MLTDAEVDRIIAAREARVAMWGDLLDRLRRHESSAALWNVPEVQAYLREAQSDLAEAEGSRAVRRFNAARAAEVLPEGNPLAGITPWHKRHGR